MFDFDEQADRLGLCVEQLDTLTKRLNTRMLDTPAAATHIDRIIGMGRFNRAVLTKPTDPKQTVAEGTILYGEELIRARTQKDNPQYGMFAAFAAVHQPLLGFAQLLAVDLGAKGYTCQITHEGHRFAIPLAELKTTFDEDARICTTGDFTDKKSGKILPGTFALLKNAGGNGLYNASKENVHCDIVDNNGTPCSPSLTATLLWVSIAGRGKNIFGKNSGKNGVLTRVGIDDMRVANMYLRETVTDLVSDHGYDPEPLWKRVMETAREQLQPHVEALAIARETIQLAQNGNTAKPLESPYKVETIDDVVKFFGITLPEMDDHKRKIAADIASGFSEGARR